MCRPLPVSGPADCRTSGRLKDNVCPPGFIPLGKYFEHQSRARDREIPASDDIEALVRVGFDQDEVTTQIGNVGVKVHRHLIGLTDRGFPPAGPQGVGT